MVFETARLWADLGAYIPAQGGAFCINEVTGPDEYTALVNNNCYTNLMARANLRYAATLADELAADAARAYDRHRRARSGSTRTEAAEWRRAAEPHAHPPRRRAGHPRAGRLVPDAAPLGLRGHAARRSTRCCSTTTRW